MTVAKVESTGVYMNKIDAAQNVLELLALHMRDGKNPNEGKTPFRHLSSIISVYKKAVMEVAHFETRAWTVRSFIELVFFAEVDERKKFHMKSRVFY